MSSKSSKRVNSYLSVLGVSLAITVASSSGALAGEATAYVDNALGYQVNADCERALLELSEAERRSPTIEERRSIVRVRTRCQIQKGQTWTAFTTIMAAREAGVDINVFVESRSTTEKNLAICAQEAAIRGLPPAGARRIIERDLFAGAKTLIDDQLFDTRLYRALLEANYRCPIALLPLPVQPNTHLRPVAWTATVLTGAAVIAAVAFGAASSNVNARDSRITYARAANVSWVTAGALGLAAGTLWAFDFLD